MKKGSEARYWVVAASLFMVMMFNCGIGYYSLSLFVTPIAKTFGISSGDVAVLYTFYGVGSALAAVSLHKLLKHVKLKYLILFGGVISAAGYTAFSIAPTFSFMFIGGILIGASTVFAGTAAVQLMIARWFVRKRSQITGIIAAASGIGTAVGGPLVGFIIRSMSWRSACLMIGLMVVVFVVVQALILMREDPQSVGMRPYGDDGIGIEPGKKADKEEGGITIRQSLAGKNFWLYAFGMAAVAVIYQIITLYQSTILIERGFSEELAATCLSVFAVVDMCSKAAAGIISDRWGFRIVTMYCSIGAAAAFFVIRATNSVAGALIFAGLLGFWPTMCVLYGVTASIALFGKEYLSEYIGFSQTLMCCCSLVGMPIIKRIYNSVGNFEIIMNIVLVLLALFFIAMVFMLRPCNLYKNLRINEEK